MRKVAEGVAIITAVRTDPESLRLTIETAVRLISEWVREAGYRLNRALPTDGSEAMRGPLRLMAYTVATLPPAAEHAGAIVYVSDGGAGTRFRGSDGTSWVSLG